MATIKTAVLASIVLFLVFPAHAENWVEITVPGGAQAFYDSDSAFLDYTTRLAVVKQAVWADQYNEYLYTLNAYDCSRWEYYTLGILKPEGWLYDYYGEMGVDSIANPYSATWKIAQWICTNYNNHPSGTIPFEFKFSNY